MSIPVAVQKARKEARALAKRKGYRNPDWVKRHLTIKARKEEASRASDAEKAALAAKEQQVT
jgi:hypothetical protein